MGDGVLRIADHGQDRQFMCLKLIEREYRIVEKFGRGFNLAVWQLSEKSAKFNPHQYLSSPHSVYDERVTLL